MPSRESSERHKKKKSHHRERYRRSRSKSRSHDRYKYGRDIDLSRRRNRNSRYRRSGSRSEDWRRSRSKSWKRDSPVVEKQKVDAFINSLVPYEPKKKKSRWGDLEENEKSVGIPTILPANLSNEQERAVILQLQIEEIGKKLIAGCLGIPEKVEERSPSPEPIYNNLGVRVNTREVRTRKKLEEQRHKLIGELIKINQKYIPPLDYRPLAAKYIDKVWIPQEEYSHVNFVGLIIGPRGTTLKQLERETGAKIIIRGKGSMKDGKMVSGVPLPGADEPLHAYITATTEECLKKAIDLVYRIVREAVEVPEAENELRKNQLRQLALINGTLLKDGSTISLTGNSSASIMTLIGNANQLTRCGQCGSEAHKTWQCPEANITTQLFCHICGGRGHIPSDCKSGLKDGTYTQLDQEYMSLMQELGQNEVLGQPTDAFGNPIIDPATSSSTYEDPETAAKRRQDEYDTMLLRNFPDYSQAQIAALQHAGLVPRRLESITPLVKKVLDKHRNEEYDDEPYSGPFSTNPMFKQSGALPTLLPTPMPGYGGFDSQQSNPSSSIPSLMSVNPFEDNKGKHSERRDSSDAERDLDDIDEDEDYYSQQAPPGLPIGPAMTQTNNPPPRSAGPPPIVNMRFSSSSHRENAAMSHSPWMNPSVLPHAAAMYGGIPCPMPQMNMMNPYGYSFPPPPGTSHDDYGNHAPPPPPDAPPGFESNQLQLAPLPPPPLPSLTGFSMDHPLPPPSPPPGTA